MAIHRRGLFITAAVALGCGRMTTMAAPLPPRVPAIASQSGGPLVMTGRVVLPADLAAGPVAPIVIRIEDVSRADAPAVTLASVTIPAGAAPPAAGQEIPFTIPVTTYDARMTYAVRAHVDRDGDGQVSVGDLVSTTHIPVLTHGAGTVVTVPVTVVG